MVMVMGICVIHLRKEPDLAGFLYATQSRDMGRSSTAKYKGAIPNSEPFRPNRRLAGIVGGLDDLGNVDFRRNWPFRQIGRCQAPPCRAHRRWVQLE